MKSPLLRGFDAPDVHLRLRKRLSRCTLDCGFQTSESPALRGFEGERGRFATTSLYLAFFFVLEKGSKSAGNAVIPTFPAHCPHGLQHLRHKRPTFAFTSESGLHTRLCSKDRTQRLTRRNRGCFGWGRYLYPRSVPHVSETLRGRVSEWRTLPLFSLGRRRSRRRRGPAGLRRPTPPAERTVLAPISPRVQLCLRRPAFPLSAFIPGA